MTGVAGRRLRSARHRNGKVLIATVAPSFLFARKEGGVRLPGPAARTEDGLTYVSSAQRTLRAAQKQNRCATIHLAGILEPFPSSAPAGAGYARPTTTGFARRLRRLAPPMATRRCPCRGRFGDLRSDNVRFESNLTARIVKRLPPALVAGAPLPGWISDAGFGQRGTRASGGAGGAG